MAAVLGAGITAVTGVVATSSARRTSYRRQQLHEMRDEAELLATLPDDHPMRADLSRLVEVRLRGYTRLFDRAVAHDFRPILPIVVSISGLLMATIVLITDGRSGTTDFVRDLFTGYVGWTNWEARQTSGFTGTYFFVMGMVLYVWGAFSVRRWVRVRRWRRAMRGDEIDPPLRKPVLEREASIPKTRRGSRGKARGKNGQGKGKRFDGPVDFDS